MADQNAAPEQEQPQADTPEQGTGVQDNWEDRYKEAQAWGTRNAQRAAELEQETQLVQQLRSDDPALQRQALEALGYQVPEDEDEFEDTQPQRLDPEIAAKLAKVDELEQWRNNLTEEQTREANEVQYRQLVDPQLETMGVPVGLRDVVAEAALNLPPLQTPQGPQPDLQGALKQFESMAEHFAALPSVQQAVKKSWASTKPNRALTSPGGQEGTEVPNLDDQQERHAYMAQKLADLNAE